MIPEYVRYILTLTLRDSDASIASGTFTLAHISEAVRVNRSMGHCYCRPHGI